jgi:hypothetical protein
VTVIDQAARQSGPSTTQCNRFAPYLFASPTPSNCLSCLPPPDLFVNSSLRYGDYTHLSHLFLHCSNPEGPTHSTACSLCTSNPRKRNRRLKWQLHSRCYHLSQPSDVHSNWRCIKSSFPPSRVLASMSLVVLSTEELVSRYLELGNITNQSYAPITSNLHSSIS